MKSLYFQKLADRKPSKIELDMAADPTNSLYSCADSGFYSVSECSTPPTPGHFARGHLRYPSSTSSLSSSPPSYDPLEAPNASGKLPKLTEEPIEPEDDYIMLDRCSYDEGFCASNRPSTGRSLFGESFDFGPDVLDNDADSHLSKRRRSGESPTMSIAHKIENRFPSFTRRVRERKRAATFNHSRSATPSRVPSRANSTTKVASTRSSSIDSSIHHPHGFNANDRFPPTPARTSRERLDSIAASSPIEIDIAKANAFDVAAEQEQVERYATTPLLPPMLVKTRFDDVPTQSPLQSPTVADPSHSIVATPIDTPPVRAYPTPPLSSRPSVSSFQAPRVGQAVPISDIPPIMLTDPNDKWADKLSHANFTIQPEPYVPEVCDAESLRQLFADWEQARCNFTKHLVRTGEHFGVTSKFYRLTEQKWAEIDALWKSNNDLAISRAAAAGTEPEPLLAVEPAPLSKMPSLNDLKNGGKFPNRGDEDIVGPMVQFASQIHNKPTRKRALFKFFSDMKFPGSFLGRSSAGIRSR